jgi:RNA polymerase sigma-70 factor (ECF subfamily)
MARHPAVNRRYTQDQPDDEALVEAASAGDRRAFQTLYQRHLDGVYGRLTRLLGPVPERDDLVQQVFVGLYRGLSRFRGEARLSTFLHRIVVNLACDHLERHRRDRGRLMPLDDERAAEVPELAASPEARVGQRQELAQVLAHLASLRPKKRIAFVLVAVEGLSLEGAAEIVGASADTVKQRVLAARRELAARLARIARREEPA